MASVECRDDDSQESNHGHTPIDKLCVAGEEVISLSGNALEHWDGGGKGEGEEGQDDGDWSCLELLKDIEASGKLCTKGCKDTKHGESAVGNLWDSASKSTALQESQHT